MGETGSLYERIGGDATIMAAVDVFYEKVLADPLTRPFFPDLDMGVLIRKQVTFMAWAFGGPSEFKGRDLRAAHAPLVARGLRDEHFDAVAAHLSSTLRELGIADDLIGEAMAIVAGHGSVSWAVSEQPARLSASAPSPCAAGVVLLGVVNGPRPCRTPPR